MSSGSSARASGSGTNDREIAMEASSFIKELEVDRVIQSFKLNPYDVLDLPFTATEGDVKRTYRKKSLLIHPDKFKHERGVEAFDWLKKAEGQLSEPASKETIDQIIFFARRTLLGQFTPPLPPTTTDDDPVLPSDWRLRVLKETRNILIDEEVQRRRAIKNTLANEGLEAKRQEEEVAERKRKADSAKTWEENRDNRVSDWRAFAAKPVKKKKKSNVLG